MKSILKKNNRFRTFILTLGFIVSGIIVLESLSQRHQEVSSVRDTYDSLKSTVQNNKSIIANTYLIGLSVYKKALD